MIKPLAIPPPSAQPRPGPSTPSPSDFVAAQTHRVNLAETLAHELGHDPTRLPAALAALTQHRTLAILASHHASPADFQAAFLILAQWRDQDCYDQELALQTRQVELMEKKFAASPSQQAAFGTEFQYDVFDEVEKRLAARHANDPSDSDNSAWVPLSNPPPNPTESR